MHFDIKNCCTWLIFNDKACLRAGPVLHPDDRTPGSGGVAVVAPYPAPAVPLLLPLRVSCQVAEGVGGIKTGFVPSCRRFANSR